MIEIGEIRKNLCQDLDKMLDVIINRMGSHLEPYWILIHADWDLMHKPEIDTPVGLKDVLGTKMRKYKTDCIADPARVLRTNFIIMPNKPTHTLVGTACVQIENKIGKATWLWVLPKDAPRPAIEQEYNSENENIFNSAKKSGTIVYG